jgi:hypothetical protein
MDAEGGAAGEQHAAAVPHAPADPPFDPAGLLTGLPDLACQTLVQCLVSSGSIKLAELMTLSKASRQLVLQHAPKIVYTPAAGRSHAELHAAATRRSGDLQLVLDFNDAPAEGAALLLQAALLRGVDGARGWTAVKELTFWVGAWEACSYLQYQIS